MPFCWWDGAGWADVHGAMQLLLPDLALSRPAALISPSSLHARNQMHQEQEHCCLGLAWAAVTAEQGDVLRGAARGRAASLGAGGWLGSPTF